MHAIHLSQLVIYLCSHATCKVPFFSEKIYITKLLLILSFIFDASQYGFVAYWPQYLTIQFNIQEKIFLLRNRNIHPCRQYTCTSGFFLSLQTTVKLAVPKTALVSGFCDEERSYLVLRYKEGEANRAVVFYLRHKGSQTLLENIETIIKLDSAKFPGAKLANG